MEKDQHDQGRTRSLSPTPATLMQCDPAAGSDEQPEGLNVFSKLLVLKVEMSSSQSA